MKFLKDRGKFTISQNCGIKKKSSAIFTKNWGRFGGFKRWYKNSQRQTGGNKKNKIKYHWNLICSRNIWLKQLERIKILECSEPSGSSVWREKVGYEKMATGSYRFYPEPVTWYEAKMSCFADGGHLVIINEIYEAVVKL